MVWPSVLPLRNGHAQSVVKCAIFFPAVATLCVAGRLVARRLQKVLPGADGWVILAALVRRCLKYQEETVQAEVLQLAVYAQMIIIPLCMLSYKDPCR